MPGLNYPGTPPVGGGGDEDIFNLTSSPEGGWTAQQTPRAVYYNGKTYFAWINGSTGDLKIASYDHATETTSAAFTLDSPGVVDAHTECAILVRDSDKRLMVAYSLDTGPNQWLRISTNPEDVSAWGGFTNLDASIGSTSYAYSQLFQLTGVTNDPIYLFFQDRSGSTERLSYSKSTDGGATWSARTVVLSSASTLRCYWYSVADDSTIDFMVSDRDLYGSEGAVDLGHMYMDGTDDKFYTSAGVEITASKPFAHSELTQLETNATGVFAFDGKAGANPVFVYFVDNGSTVTAKYARWDGSAWDKADIYTANHLTFDRYYGYLAINPTDAEEVFSGVYSGTNQSELYTYVSADLGATWDAGTAITSGSADYNAGVTAVKNGVAALPIIWLRGTWSSPSSFAWSIKGLRR
jgi:hypothetical protein